MRTTRLIGHYDAETTTYSPCAGALQTSPYTPDFSGTLIGVRVMVWGGAATSLVQGILVRLTSTTFIPNTLHVSGQGAGIQTALYNQTQAVDWSVSQKVVSGVPLHVEALNSAGAETPVTVNVGIFGIFDN